MIFPETLDNAHVLYFTPQASYGTVCFTTGKIADHICYLAICKYENDNNYYLFGCDSNYDVVSDYPWCSVEECMRVASSSYDCDISWIAAV